MDWLKLESEEQLEQIKKESENTPVLIFKHSTTCSISATALSRFERNWNAEEAKGLKSYYLDLLRFRPISNKIASEFGVEHESPQILLIKNGESVYSESHYGISFQEIVEQIH